jgi:hypothetical protein
MLSAENYAVSEVTVQAGGDVMDREATVKWFRQAAVKAAREAMSRDSKWRTKLRLLSGKEGTSMEGTDLESVKDDLTELLGN